MSYISVGQRQELATAVEYLALMAQVGTPARIRAAVVAVSEVVSELPSAQPMSAFQAAVEFQQSVRQLVAAFTE